VVVIAPSREERRLGVPLGDGQADDIAIKAHGALQVDDPQVDVADIGLRADNRGNVWELGEVVRPG
jgi:hypothetical protein